MDSDDHRVTDPPLQPNESSDDEFYGGPPTPWSGVVLHLFINLTLKQMVAQLFHLDVDTPGLVRILCNSTPIDLRTSIAGLDWPRRVYVQVSSFTEYPKKPESFSSASTCPGCPHRKSIMHEVLFQFTCTFISFQCSELCSNMIISLAHSPLRSNA